MKKSDIVCDGPPLTREAKTAIAEEKIKTALRLIERAQGELNEACAQISPIIGMVAEWEKLGAEAMRVKKLWHQVNDRFQSERGDWKVDAL